MWAVREDGAPLIQYSAPAKQGHYTLQSLAFGVIQLGNADQGDDTTMVVIGYLRKGFEVLSTRGYID